MSEPGTKGSIRVRVAHPEQAGVYFQAMADYIFLADDGIGEVLVAVHSGILPSPGVTNDLDSGPPSELDHHVVETATVMPQGMLLVSQGGRVLQRNSRVRQLLGPIVDRDDGEAWLEQVASTHLETARQIITAAAAGERRTVTNDRVSNAVTPS